MKIDDEISISESAWVKYGATKNNLELSRLNASRIHRSLGFRDAAHANGRFAK